MTAPKEIKRSDVVLKEKFAAAVKILKEHGYTKPSHIKSYIFKEFPQYDTIKGNQKLDNVLGYKSGDAQLTDIIEDLARKFTKQV